VTEHKPGWWTAAHAITWENVKDALHRDWDQTRRDLDLGGHELNQNMHNTLAQAVGAEAAPAIDVANPPVVIGRWEDAETAIGFGYAARTHYGDRYPAWDLELSRQLAKDWKSESMPWKTSEIYIHHGYDVRR
jgi:hypothetical protein